MESWRLKYNDDTCHYSYFPWGYWRLCATTLFNLITNYYNCNYRERKKLCVHGFFFFNVLVTVCLFLLCFGVHFHQIFSLPIIIKLVMKITFRIAFRGYKIYSFWCTQCLLPFNKTMLFWHLFFSLGIVRCQCFLSQLWKHLISKAASQLLNYLCLW